VRKTLRLAAATEIGLADGATGSATITAAPGFSVAASDASSACLVSVADGKPDVWLRDVNLAQDPSLTLSGACVRRGVLALRRVRVSGFRAGGLSATCLPASGLRSRHRPQPVNHAARAQLAVDGNRNAAKGGGIASEGAGATVLVAHSAIVNNAFDNDGGGIYLGGGWNTDFIKSSTISGNTTSGAGGGVLVRFVQSTTTYVHIFNSTITNNVASGTGGGIEFEPPPTEVGTAPRHLGVLQHRGGQLLPCRRRWNGTSTRPGIGRRASSTASAGRSSTSHPGTRGRPTWAGASSTFATRSWARSFRWAARTTCRFTRCWWAARSSTRRRTTPRATISATAGSPTSIRRNPPAGPSSIRSSTATATGRPRAISVRTSAATAGRPSCSPCGRKVRPRTPW
jgi:hypothetical protein